MPLILHLPVIKGGGGAMPAQMDPGPTFPAKLRKFIAISLISISRLRLPGNVPSPILHLEKVVVMHESCRR